MKSALLHQKEEDRLIALIIRFKAKEVSMH